MRWSYNQLALQSNCRSLYSWLYKVSHELQNQKFNVQQFFCKWKNQLNFMNIFLTINFLHRTEIETTIGTNSIIMSDSWISVRFWLTINTIYQWKVGWPHPERVISGHLNSKGPPFKIFSTKFHTPLYILSVIKRSVTNAKYCDFWHVFHNFECL
jgi:hypothetical protein